MHSQSIRSFILNWLSVFLTKIRLHKLDILLNIQHKKMGKPQLFLFRVFRYRHILKELERLVIKDTVFISIFAKAIQNL